MQIFCIASIGAILGIIMGLYFKSIAIFISICAFFIFLCITVKKFIRSKKYLIYFIILIIFFYSFFGYITFLELQYKKIYESYEDKEISIQAIVISNPKPKDYKDTYTIKVIKIKNLESGKEYNKYFNLLCNIKKNNQTSLNLEYGDIIELVSTYEVPDISKNAGGFNYQQYLKVSKIAGIVTTSTTDIQILGKSNNNLVMKNIFKLKNNLIEKIRKILPEENAGACIGLLLGDKTYINEEIQESFKKSSLSHMLAISGAHVSYLLLGLTNFFNIIKLHKRWCKVISILFLTFFMMLVGFTPSVTRACIMAILTLLAEICFRKSNVYQNLAISSLIILLINPYALLDIGFQLSFGGTIGIVFLMRRINIEKNVQIQPNNKKINSKLISLNKFLLAFDRLKIGNKLITYCKQIFQVSVSANIIIWPIMLYHFNTISFTFLISNLLASSVLGASLILGMIFIIFLIVFKPVAILISYILNLFLQILIQIAKITGNLPFSQILVPTPKIWQIVLYYIIILLFYISSKINSINKFQKFFIHYKKTISIIIILIILFPFFIKLPKTCLEIHFIDVGQGDSMLIETPSRHTILIDGGGSEMGSFDVGEKTLLPYLLDKNIMRIDYMMFSHLDSDHCQGLFTIIEKLKVKNIIIGKQGEISSNLKKLFQLLKNKKVNVILVKAGDRIDVDRYCYFDILFPEVDIISENVLNNNSIVAKFNYSNKKNDIIFDMLLTGDIEKIAEERIIELYKNSTILRSTALKVAHHGSKTSSILNFLQLVNPQIALIGVGENNKFGHPSEITLNNLKNLRYRNL